MVLALCMPLIPVGDAEVFAQGPVVSAIRIQGNQRVEDDAIRIHISQRAGEPLDEKVVDQDIKSIYEMGFFDTVDARLVTSRGKNVLIYRVKERPEIVKVEIKGMKEFKPTDDKIVNALKIHAGSILDPGRVKDTETALKAVYQDKGYLDARIGFKTLLRPNNTAVGEFDVTEGLPVEIAAIKFSGDRAFSGRRLRAEMETAPHNFLSFLTGSGVLDRKKLRQDVDRLTAFYYDHGYLNVHVAEPQITRHGHQLTITIAIDEGPVYRLGTVELAGNFKFPRAELTKMLTIKSGEQFSGTALQHNVLTLSDFYSNRGYAFVNVEPRTRLDPQNKLVNVTFEINPGQEVLVNRIHITGNTKTSDKVIRRELQLQEQEPYSAEAIRESKRRLDRLGFFSETRITTSPSSQPDRIDLNVHVAEANTASLQVAGGFDTYESVFGTFSLGNTNLFGGGESILIQAAVGFLFQNYSISYTEPWLLDMPLSVTTSLFDNQYDLFNFTQSAAGFSLSTYYPLTDLGFKKIGPFSLKDVTAGLGYQFESVGITDVAPDTTFAIRRYEGYTQVSELMPSIKRFTVDNPIDPRTGSVESLNMEFGGLGPGLAFVKTVAHARFFYTFLKSPVFGQWVVSPGVTYGIGTTLSNGYGSELPLYERFFPGGLGGMGDVRGYQLYSLGPEVVMYNQAGQPLEIQDIGGSQELLLSGEVTFPLLSALGIRGVVFSDAGQAYTLRQSINFDSLQASWGVGIRWRSPFGPLALDIARPINPRPQDQSTVFEIGAGSPL
jgi:outer membrane protein insertion porin family